MPHEMVMPRKYLLRSVFGYVIQFLPNEPTNVPTQVVPEAAKLGATMVDPTESIGEDQIGEDGMVTEAKATVSLSIEERAEALKSALETLEATNNPDHFTAAGYPKIAIVRSTSGVVDAAVKEVNSAWDELTAPPNADED